MTGIDPTERVAGLSIWKGPVRPERLGGGFTNINYIVEDGGARYVVRVGDDIPVHQIMRFNERAASRAAFAAGISPEVIHSEPGILVMRYVEGQTCTPADIRDPARLAKILPLVKRVHRDIPNHLRGPVLAFWVFHVIRDYAHRSRRRAAATPRGCPSWSTSPPGSSLRSGRSTSSSATTTCSPATSSTTASASG